MITLQCELELSKTDKELLLKLMRKFSSCMRYAYKRLLEGKVRKDLKKELQPIFNINSRYVDDAIMKAQSVINSYKELNKNPTKVIFGGRKLFNQLKSKHLTGKRYKELKREWKEKRLLLYSRGDKTKSGNLNIRLIKENDNWYLRINTDNRQWIKAKIIRKVKRGTDKWIDFIWRLTEAELTNNYFPYSVEIKQKNGKIYANISYEEIIPEIKYTKENGIVGLDINASPIHIALANVSIDGNLIRYKPISLHELIGKTKNQREYLLWQIAYKVINYAKENEKAIAIERLEGINKGYRGDGKPKLRKRFEHWSYKSLLTKIKILGQRNGMQVIEVNPAYTSIIGAYKYCPQYLIDKDIAGAYVIGRRGLGYKDDIPENYLKLLSNKEYLEYSIAKLEEKKEELKELLKNEKNIYKRKPIKQEVSKINKDIKLLKLNIQNLNSNPKTQKQVNQRKEPVRDEYFKYSYKLWRVVKAAFGIPILGKSFVRDFSPLKTLLTDWDRIPRRLVPVLGAGTMVSQIPPVGYMANLNWRTKSRPTKSVSFIHF
ncbi:IS200/IS605 family accessory protein TnpB-related protein [Caldisericum exile]|uniref:Transposase for insertion sequence element n=1 Tax=Caldisericum exile (strain DSM 21853 / NBRC 104410 / AZM16c01) TaxID=511051 RepID=A0A7U6GFN2_CALEA|nr:IS200/IS605 family accessory protein TnpB-related protein [Caldisericum exile]BAL81526.1 putative transposase for insertion sequence element [Caldisericum exile AZM16c01]